MGKRVNLSKIEKPVKDDNNSDGTVTLTGEELRIFLNVLHKIDDNLMGLATLNHNVIIAKEQVRTYTDGIPAFKEYVELGTRIQAERKTVKNLESTTDSFVCNIEQKLKDSEARLSSIDGCIAIPTQAVYISFVCMVSLATFMLCIIILNLQFWHSSLIWKFVGITIGIAVIGVAITHYLPIWIEKFRKD